MSSGEFKRRRTRSVVNRSTLCTTQVSYYFVRRCLSKIDIISWYDCARGTAHINTNRTKYIPQIKSVRMLRPALHHSLRNISQIKCCFTLHTMIGEYA